MYVMVLSGVVAGPCQYPDKGGVNNPDRVVDCVGWRKSSKERGVDRIGEDTCTYAEGYCCEGGDSHDAKESCLPDTSVFWGHHLDLLAGDFAGFEITLTGGRRSTVGRTPTTGPCSLVFKAVSPKHYGCGLASKIYSTPVAY